MLSVNEVAARLGVTPRRIRALIKAGKLVAQKLGRDWVISEKALEKAERERRKEL